MAPALLLSRSSLLALWLGTVVVGSRTPAAPPRPATPPALGTLLAAVQGDDEDHVLTLDDESHPLADALRTWVPDLRAVASVVAVPGDVGAAPSVVGAAVADAGECVLLHVGDAFLAATPQVVRFGSDLEPGHLVTWQVTPTPDWRPGARAQGTVDDVARELRQGLVTVTEALVRLDVARWDPRDAEAVAAARDGALPHRRLPDSLDQRRAQAATSAARLRAIVALALRDDGGAVNLWQVDQRLAALRDVDRMARRALSAATTFVPRD